MCWDFVFAAKPFQWPSKKNVFTFTRAICYSSWLIPLVKTRCLTMFAESLAKFRRALMFCLTMWVGYSICYCIALHCIMKFNVCLVCLVRRPTGKVGEWLVKFCTALYFFLFGPNLKLDILNNLGHSIFTFGKFKLLANVLFSKHLKRFCISLYLKISKTVHIKF